MPYKDPVKHRQMDRIYQARWRKSPAGVAYRERRRLARFHNPRDRVAEFLAKIDRSGGPDACWPWRKYIDIRGYGVAGSNGPLERLAHRRAYTLLVGPIPEGLTLDHLCRNRACVNPAHLEPVTLVENIMRGMSASAIHARKTHCIHGHEFTPENIYRNGTGRKCKACYRRGGPLYISPQERRERSQRRIERAS